MRRWTILAGRRTRAAAGALLLLAVFEGRAQAFCRTTTCSSQGTLETPIDSCTLPSQRTDPRCREDCCRLVIWKRPCISFSLDTSNLRPDQIDGTRALLTRAIKTWTNTICPGTRLKPALTVSDTFGPVLCGHAEYNSDQGNANIITFRKNWPYNPEELGHTVVTYLVATGELLDADIEMNADAIGEGYDLQSVLTHEFGHFIGIAHTDPSNQALSIMRPRYDDPDDLYHSLRPDDVSALCELYGTKVEPTAWCDYTPVNGFIAECAFDPGSGGWCAARPGRLPGRGEDLAVLLAVLGSAAALRRRRRQATG